LPLGWEPMTDEVAERAKSATETGARARATFRDVFGVGEFRALWLALVLSVSGDQLARVALTVLVYDRTRSALLAAVTFAASVVPTFVGGVVLSGIADRLPRRRVMIGADLTSGVLVAVMVLPGLPLAVLIMLLVAVTMVGALFLAARAATFPEILDGDRYVLGSAVTMTTVLFAQVAGFAVGGVVVGFLGVRVSLLADAATFGASALITRTWVRARPVPAASPPLSAQRLPAAPRQGRGRHARPAPSAAVVAGLRLVFGNRAMRTPMLFGWLCAFYELPQGVATPLAAAAGGGALAVGLILAAQALGSAVGAAAFSRLVGAAQRVKWTGPLAIATCASLVPFAAGPSFLAALLILAVSGLFGCYQIAANASFVQATPAAQRSQAFGIAQGGISLCQGTAIILGGAAAQHTSPASVIAAAGGIGALCALALTLTAARAERHPAAHRRRWGPNSAGTCRSDRLASAVRSASALRSHLGKGKGGRAVRRTTCG
jgi:MFS family permease